ncbi:putative glutamate receptor isoform X2 [Ptiloglossa arizonensis]|uniref:putative glutamate receptor isoform X2 n=1 Tax=Ptiloglossa arizonensis TaxID=3350558 RepID=UPI003F9EC238
MRELLLLVVLQVLLRPVQSVNGVIWDKKCKDFVPIFNISAFAAKNQELLNQSRKKEIHNFQKKVVTLSYYEITNLINNDANGLKVTGVIGEVWNTLAEFLNFTLKPILIEEPVLGFSNATGNYTFGLLKSLQNNETDVVPRVEAYNIRRSATQFSMPLWKTSIQLYSRRDVKHLPTWMLKLFSREVWYAILIMYFVLSFCSYVSHATDSKITGKKSKTKWSDHLFYNFGMICGQSYLPSGLSKSSKIVELWLGLFSCLMRTAFGALLISYMTQTITTPPFRDLESLLDQTSYTILTLRGSLPNAILKISNLTIFKKLRKMKRIKDIDTMEELYKSVCSLSNLNAVFQSQDIKKAAGVYFCRLNPAEVSIQDLWIVSGISRNFSYKRSIDLGILKLYEVGIMQLLKHRWIETKNAEETASNKTEPIIMEEEEPSQYLIPC